MKTAKFMVATLALVAFSFLVKAQETEAPWYIVEYMKVKPGMLEEYEKCEQAWKAIHKERIRLGKITSWALYYVAFPSGSDVEYEYVTITEVKGWNGVENASSGWEDVMKVITPEMQPIVDKTEEYRALISREVWQTGASIFKEDATGFAKYQVCNFMDVPDDGWHDYWDMETKLVQPVHQLGINAGRRLGWGLYTLTLPYGANQPYQAATVDFFNAWSDINANSGEDWMKAHPDMDEAYVNRRITQTRTLVRSEIRVLIDSVN